MEYVEFLQSAKSPWKLRHSQGGLCMIFHQELFSLMHACMHACTHLRGHTGSEWAFVALRDLPECRLLLHGYPFPCPAAALPRLCSQLGRLSGHFLWMQETPQNAAVSPAQFGMDTQRLKLNTVCGFTLISPSCFANADACDGTLAGSDC